MALLDQAIELSLVLAAVLLGGTIAATIRRIGALRRLAAHQQVVFTSKLGSDPVADIPPGVLASATQVGNEMVRLPVNLSFEVTGAVLQQLITRGRPVELDIRRYIFMAARSTLLVATVGAVLSSLGLYFFSRSEQVVFGAVGWFTAVCGWFVVYAAAREAANRHPLEQAREQFIAQKVTEQFSRVSPPEIGPDFRGGAGGQNRPR